MSKPPNLKCCDGPHWPREPHVWKDSMLFHSQRVTLQGPVTEIKQEVTPIKHGGARKGAGRKPTGLAVSNAARQRAYRGRRATLKRYGSSCLAVD